MHAELGRLKWIGRWHAGFGNRSRGSRWLFDPKYRRWRMKHIWSLSRKSKNTHTHSGWHNIADTYTWVCGGGEGYRTKVWAMIINDVDPLSTVLGVSNGSPMFYPDCLQPFRPSVYSYRLCWPSTTPC